MKTYPIPAPLLQEIVAFLRLQPWLQVNNMLVGINSIVTAIDQPSAFAKNGKEEEQRLAQ
jgi:hypothetical protein